MAGTIDEHHTDYMFTSETAGVSLASDVIKVTRDGGRSWQPVFPCAAKIQVNGLFKNVTCEWRRLQFVTPLVAYAVAKSYSERKGLTYAAWREAAVDARVLKQAGITRGPGA